VQPKNTHSYQSIGYFEIGLNPLTQFGIETQPDIHILTTDKRLWLCAEFCGFVKSDFQKL